MLGFCICAQGLKHMNKPDFPGCLLCNIITNYHINTPVTYRVCLCRYQ